MSEMENIEFKTFKAGKELPFSTPDGYFDSLSARIQDKIQATQTKFETKSEQGAWIVTFRSQLAFAAGFAFMAVMAYFGYYLARPFAKNAKTPVGTDYVEIVSRSISDFEDIDLYRAIENKQKKDSVEVAKEMNRKYYIRSNNCITIIDEKKEIEP